jgi:hypothetical protein
LIMNAHPQAVAGWESSRHLFAARDCDGHLAVIQGKIISL